MRGWSNSGTFMSYSCTAMHANGRRIQRTPGSRIPTKRPCLHRRARSDCAIVRRGVMVVSSFVGSKTQKPRSACRPGFLAGVLEGTPPSSTVAERLTARVHTINNRAQSGAEHQGAGGREGDEDICDDGTSF